jgi:biofilm protein TabA
MVVDKIKNVKLYHGLGERLAQGLKLIKDPLVCKKTPGEYEVDGKNLYYIIQGYTTKDRVDTRFEAHRDYIDIQAVIDGAESIGWAPTDTLEVTEPYVPDVGFYQDPAVFTELRLTQGMFAIFYPSDAHKPCYDYQEKGLSLKVVVKVKI